MRPFFSLCSKGFDAYKTFTEIGYDKMLHPKNIFSLLEGMGRLLFGLPFVAYWSCRSIVALFCPLGSIEHKTVIASQKILKQIDNLKTDKERLEYLLKNLNECSTLETAIFFINKLVPDHDSQEALRAYIFLEDSFFTKNHLNAQLELFYAMQALFWTGSSVGPKEGDRFFPMTADTNIQGDLESTKGQDEACQRLARYFTLTKLSGAISSYEDTLKQPLRELVPLDHRRFSGKQEIKGDGNCYYRASMYYYIGSLLAQKNQEKLQNLANSIPENDSFSPLKTTLNLYCQKIKTNPDANLVKQFQEDINATLDLPIIKFARDVAYRYLENHQQGLVNYFKEDSWKGMIANDIEEGLKLLPYKEEGERNFDAEGIILNANPLGKALGFSIQPVMGGDYQNCELLFPLSNEEVVAYLYLHEGHYDLLFPIEDPMWEALQSD